METQKYTICLVRTGESEYNRQHDKDREDPRCKFDCNLLDCGLTPEGQRQAEEQGKNLKDITLIFCSPLRRSLQTVQAMIKDFKKKPKVVVLPDLKEKTLGSCDLSKGDMNELKKEFPNYDFSALEKYEKPEYWEFYLLDPEHQDKVFKRINESGRSVSETKKDLIETLIKNEYPNFESDRNLEERYKNAKRIIKETMETLPEGQNVVVVTHYNMLQHFTQKDMEPDGRPKEAHVFDNAEVLSHFV